MTEKRFTFYRNEEFDTPVIYDKEDEVYLSISTLKRIFVRKMIFIYNGVTLLVATGI